MMSLNWWETNYLIANGASAEPSEDLGPLTTLIKLVSSGSYVEALKSQTFQEIASFTKNGNLRDRLQESLTHYLSQNADSEEALHTVLCFGIAGLQLFVQNNFTGPLVGPDPSSVIPFLDTDSEEQRKKHVVDYISQDTEGVYDLLKCPEYFVLAKIVFVELKETLSSLCKSTGWWNLRFNFVLQKIADEFSGTLYDRIQSEVAAIEANGFLCPENREQISLFFIEAGQAFLQFGDIANAADKFNRAKSFLRLNSNLAGALGKRTKHQCDNKPQLIVKVQYDDMSILADKLQEPVLLDEDLPHDILLDDDTRLNIWQFKDRDDDVVPSLTSLEQIGALLTDIQYKKRSRAQDIQDIDETRAYLRALLQFPKCWGVQYLALKFRSHIEANESRAVTRARCQLEEIVASVKREEPSRFQRLKLFYAADIPCFWQTQQSYGEILVSIGETKTALSLFEDIKLWDNVIECYNRLQMRNNAAKIIKSLLAEEETPKLLCLLGDATDDKSCYEKAWEVSGGKSSRSQRSLGDYYMGRKSFEEAVGYYRKSIEVSHIQIKVWEHLAYCYMKLEDWSNAASAYKKCTVLEPDQFEYWNNLGSCYTHSRDYEKAHNCFKETARLASNSWKVFQNLVFSSISCEDYNYSLYAYKRFYDMAAKEDRVNPILLEKMVTGFLDSTADDDTEQSKQLHQQYLTFFSGLCQKEFKEFIVWYEYGELLSKKSEDSVETRDLTFQKFRKCLAIVGEQVTKGSILKSDTGITKHELIYRAIQVLQRTVQALLDSTKGVPAEVSLQTARSFMFSFGRFMDRCREGLKDVTGTVVPAGVKPLEDGLAAIQQINDLIASLGNDSK